MIWIERTAWIIVMIIIMIIYYNEGYKSATEKWISYYTKILKKIIK